MYSIKAGGEQFGRLSTLQNVHYWRFHCIYISLRVGKQSGVFRTKLGRRSLRQFSGMYVIKSII